MSLENHNPAYPEKAVLVEWIRNWLEINLDSAKGSVAVDKKFVDLGLDSVHAMMLVGDLEDHLSRRLSPTLAWDYPTVDALAEYLSATSTEASMSSKEPRDSEILERLDDLSEEEIDQLLKERLG